jgi:short-subunit dehydrogenase
MANYFKHKRVWITGASSGIGEALALAFAAENAHLVLSSRKERDLEQVANACMAAGAASASIQVLDLANHASLPEIADSVLKTFGKIDVLVNNGGISQRALAIDTDLSIDKRLMDINYFGTIALTKAVLPSMITHQLGHIVVISSLTGKFGAPLRSAYAASKHALHGFFDCLRIELGEAPIHISMICPGYVKTNVSINALTGDGSAQGTMDPSTGAGMDPANLAQKILKAVRAKKEEAVFGGKETLGVYLKRFFPKFFSNMMKKRSLKA